MKQRYRREIDIKTYHKKLGALLGYPADDVEKFIATMSGKKGAYDNTLTILNQIIRVEQPRLYDTLQGNDPIFSQLLEPRGKPGRHTSM